MSRPAASPIFQANVVLVVAMVLGMLIALVLGMMVGESDVKPLLLIFLAVTGIAYAVWLHRYFWQLALFLLYFSFTYKPTSFTFGGTELACALGFGVMVIFFWQKQSHDRAEILAQTGFKFLESVLFFWLVYVALHLIFNAKIPYLPSEFKLTNALKSYFAVSAPLALFFFFSRNPAGVLPGKDFFWRVTQLLTLGLIVNLVIRVYELKTGHVVFVPLLNATSNGFALRALGPLAMLIGAVGVTGPHSERRSALRLSTFWLLAASGCAGSILSGGRAAIVYGFICVCTVLFFRRKVVALASIVGVAILAVALANLSAHWINTRANPAVQRSLQWVLFQKNWETVGDLESSTNWRNELYKRSIDEWRSDPRIFWTGRATFGFGAADETAILIAGGYEALIETSIRRGATHNLVTDMLVAYGIIGCVLYFGVYLAMIRFLWRLYRSRALTDPALNLTLTCLVGTIFALGLDLTSGGNIPPDLLICSLVLVAAIYNGVALAPERAATARNAPVPIAVSKRERFRPRPAPLLQRG
ncbi:MAG: O-antigen ligase family protein [Verrucomicrobiota bacterium]|nr:O-antigen ligase family protein [Verrucomicrobiota bacterium]